MLRILTDNQRATYGYNGPFMPIDIGVDVADVKKDLSCPSGQLLAYYSKQFSSQQAFLTFVQEIIGKPTGTALDGRITWRT